MIKLHPIMLFEITRAAVSIASWWVLFYKLHRPPTKLRRIAQLAAFVISYTSWMLIPLSDTGNVILWASMIIFFAVLAGDLRKSFFTALYYIGIEATIDTIRYFFIMCIFGKTFRGYTREYYIQFNLQYLFVLGWTVFYYWIMKKHDKKLPLRFWIMTVIPPFGTTILLTRYADVARASLATGTNIYIEGILFGFFLFALNLFTIYMYIRLITYYDSYLKSQGLQAQLEVYAHQSDIIEGSQKQVAEIRHEIKNILFVLQIEMEKQNYDGVKTRLNKLMGDLKQYEQKPYTGVSVIDAMIAYKAEKIQEYGATLSVSAELLDISDTVAYDVASCLAITLDNAVDAIASYNAAPQEAEVRCALWRQKNMLFIRVTNPLVKPLSYHNGELQSTKQEAGHGLGLPALRRIVEQYSGEVKIDSQGGIFSLLVMLMQ
ncbi:MAG: GHKL domain-containing protein [Treponema sp.]|nr:GHKL domain-containing protein [Treponema sp.]